MNSGQNNTVGTYGWAIYCIILYNAHRISVHTLGGGERSTRLHRGSVASGCAEMAKLNGRRALRVCV